MTTSRTSIVNIHCPPSSTHGWQVESGYYSDSYNNSSSSMSNIKKQPSSQSGVHQPSSTCCTSFIPPPPSTNLLHRSSCHKRHHQTTKDIILCSCAHQSYLQHKINGSNHSNMNTNSSLLCTMDRYTHSNTNMKPISEHQTEHLNCSSTDSNTSPPSTTSNDDESGSHSAMDSTVLSPLLPSSQIVPPPLPPLPPPTHFPLIPVDHTTLLSQIKATTRNSILLCGDNISTTTNSYMADSGFDSSSSHAIGPSVPSSSTPCTAFMIQTQAGNALLIPHSQGTLMSSSSNIDRNGNSSINNGTFPFQSSAYSCPNSTQLTTMSTIDRPNSNSSNVYQTIDADSFRNNCYVYPLDHHHHHSHSHMRCNCDSTTTYNEQTTTTTRQSTHSPCPLFNNSICRSKKRSSDDSYFQRQFFSWKTIAIVLLLTTLCFLTSTIYLSTMRYYNPTFRENNLTQGKSRQPNLFYGKTTRFIRIGDKIKETIDSQSSTQLQFYIERTISIQFNFTGDREANFGFYGKRSSSPSLTQFDFFHPFNGNTQQHHLVRRSLSLNRTSQIYLTNSRDEQLTLLFNELLTTGLWYVTIINDGLIRQEFQLIIEQIDGKNERLCLNNCNNHGICQQGICICQPSYTGTDCSIAQCTDLCSGHGVVEHGQCRCQEGWHGSECQLMLNQCEIANCNNRGTCIAGKCVCQNGYQGNFCEQISCTNVNCSNHGICIEGKCRCFHGYTNDDCSLVIQTQCDNQCSGHGQYVDYPKSMCICDENWTGDNCSQPKCNIDCGLHGKCLINDRNRCECDEGWIGKNCMKKTCSKLCQQCNDDGSCRCQNGFLGRYCQIDACPNNCNGHGDCQMNKCICHSNWFGSECQFTIENNCNDRMDNDNDGLVDCLDPDCCSSSVCQSTDECISRTNAKDILLRRQAPSPSASFFERMQFLIQEDGLQTSTIYSSFNERRASVIRGQIFYKKSLPLNGVKVQVFNNPNQGYTISDKDGFFNLLINGGGSILIQFIRQPFQSKQYAFIVPWNTFLHVGYIYMDEILNNTICHTNLSNNIQPKLWDTSLDRHFLPNHQYDYAYTLGSQIIRQSISIEKNDLPIQLMYLSSSSTRRYHSILTVVLSDNDIDEHLLHIHLSISIEGIYFSKIFHAQTNLIYEYEWSRRNAYDQNVHGLAEAIVSIGYEYMNCNQIFWYRKSVKMTGQDIPTANVGGWTFDVHHKLNIQAGILYKGDGTTMLLTDSPLQFSTLIGMRDQSRSIDCRKCHENQAILTRLLNPTSLTVSNDGIIYIGDLNIIWMYQPLTNLVKPVLELNEQYTYKYYLSTDPVDGRLYISDYHRRQIIRLLKIESIDNLRENYEIVVGDGQYCTIDVIHNITCGDSQLAKDVSLSYPKGLTIDRYGTIYFIDGQRIRKLSIENSHVTNLIGTVEYQIDFSKQFSCNRTYSLDQFKLYNPTTLHIHPLDGDLYVLDDIHLYRIRKNFNQIEIILGPSLNCLTNDYTFQLNNPIDFSFNYQGDLFLLEKSSPYLRVLRSSNNQLEPLNIQLNNIKMNFLSIINHPDGSILLANVASKEIFKLKSISLTNDDEQTNGLNIHSNDKNEIYVFNRVGQHRSTIDSLTGEAIFNFTYDSPQNAYGKLESMNYRNGKSLLLKYDYAMRVNDIIQMPNGNKLKIDFSKQKFLSNFIDNNGLSTQFLYDNGLLTSIIKNNLVRIHFLYDKAGHIQRITHEDGYFNELIPSANRSFYRIDSLNPNGNITYLINKSTRIQSKNKQSRLIRRDLSNSSIIISESNPSLKLITSSSVTNRHQIIEFNSSLQFSNSLVFDQEQSHSWHLKINDNLILTMSFDPFERKLIIQDYKQNELLTMFYSNKHRLISMNSRGFLPISYTYRDSDQKLSSWKIGSYYEEFLYDTRGRLIEIQRFNDLASIKYSYGSGEQPVGITYGSQSNVMLRKDATGCITGIIMPNQAEHTLEYRTYFNGYRLIYTGLHTQIWEYDSNSNLRRIYFPFHRLITYKYDENNRLIYSFADGFGLLIKYKSNQLIIEYIYDHEQRLIMKIYPLTGYYIQFIYGNQQQQQRRLITHIYHSQMKTLITIYYDNNNHLIGFEENQRKFFVLTDQIGSPLFIYDNNGLLIQEKFYGLYGRNLIEKNYQEKRFFPFGYAGLLIDEELNCAFEKLTGKLFDYNLGRYLVPNFPLTWMKKQTYLPVIHNPLNDMNLYKINDEIYNVNEVIFQRLHQHDILKQLQNLNYDFSNLFDSILSSSYLSNENHLLEENSLISSSFFTYFNEYYSINYPNQFSYSIAHIQNDNDFWINRTLSIKNLSNQIEFLSFTSYDDVFSRLFNQSYLLPYRKQNEIYFLQNFTHFHQLKSHLNQPLFRQFKINIRYQTTKENLIDIDLIISNTTIFHMKFGSTYDEEYRRLIEYNLSQMITNVWQYERTYLMENARLYYLYPWSSNEIDELISNGYLTNYTITYRYDPLIYSEIIDDPTNFMFHIKT
ncbi:hypothetical protein I4U23_028429 [Adineta vaga]|nr:hypothetical protein I4U23_028429 [Adineta vaga]